jgi:hypothetical protein
MSAPARKAAWIMAGCHRRHQVTTAAANANSVSKSVLDGRAERAMAWSCKSMRS